MPRDALEALAARAQGGDERAFDELAAIVSTRLMAFARGTLRDKMLAEEAVQEALTRIYRFLGSYERGSFLAWSMQIARNVCIDVATREGKHQHLRLVDERDDDAEPGSVATVRDGVEDIEIRIRIEEALAKLTEAHRTAFLLTVQGLRYEETAEICGVPIGTVRSRLFHARVQLRAHLEDLLER